MAKMNFGGVIEEVVTRSEFPLESALDALRGETIAILGYGVQGPGQACTPRDGGFNVIVGQRPGKTYDKAVADGWEPGETLFSIEEAARRATIVCMLLSDAAQMQLWPTIKPVMQRLYRSVAAGEEAQRSIDSNSQPGYREKLEAELAALRESEMWRTGETVRQLRPESK